MKIPPATTDNFIARPPANIHAALIYGPDSGLVSIRASTLHHAIIDQPKDPFRNIEIDYKKIKKDPSLLSDELNTRSLIGGRRYIKITNVENTLPKPIIEILQSYQGDSFSLWMADELPPTSSLRKTFESEKNLAAIACYKDDSTTVKPVIVQYLKKQGFTIAPSAVDILSHRFSGDRLMVLSELEKLMSYKWESKSIDSQDVEECSTNHLELSLDTLCHAVASGNVKEIEKAFRLATEEGTSAITMIRTLMNYFMRLHTVRIKIDAGEPEQVAISSLRPPLFFKYIPGFKQQLQLWNERKLSATLSALNDLEQQCKYNVLPAELLLEHFLVLIPYRYNLRA